jgi:SAM-dependent methyltransferase
MTDFDWIRDYWDRHAERDPLWAVLSEESKSGGRWDLGRFFQTGVSEITSVLYQFDSRRLDVPRRSALDFGCGVGRLTQALAPHFHHVVGVDVSPRMLALANAFNGFPSRVLYLNNQRDDLRLFGDATFDFVISNIVLQHVPPDLALAYVGEFFRVLAADGALVFQIPSHRRTPADSSPPSGPHAMPDEAYQAAIAVTGVTDLELRAGASLTLDVVVANTSPHDWAASECGAIRLGNHWRDATGDRMLSRDDGRSSLPEVVRAGERCRVALTITAPAYDGEYVCEIDLAHEGVLWFNDKGSPTARLSVRVGTLPRDVGRRSRSVQTLASTPERVLDLSAMSANVAGHAGCPDPGDFPMHGIDREIMIDFIARHGGRLVHIEDDHSCGAEWVSFRYYVKRT